MSDPRPVKPFGLTQVYASRGDPTVDIVLVHGLNGHPRDSWTSKSGCFWPVDLLPGVLAPLRPRILTYGYNANVAAFTDGASRDSIVSHAETLVSNLAANRNLWNCSERPLIFVCHSLGGLVVKRALIYSRSVADEHLRSVYVSTFGILFLGTPHNRSDAAKWGLLLHNICSAVLPRKLIEASPQLVEALRKDNETLQHINSLFDDIMSRFHIYLFHETRSMDVKGTRQIIVDEASAAPHLEGVERMGIEADHSHICKFGDENAPGYEVVAEAILRYSRQAPTVIVDRWVEERKTRVLEKKAKAREIYDGRVDGPAGRSMLDLNEPGQLFVSLIGAPASDRGRDSPVSDLGNSLLFSQNSDKDRPLFVAPSGFYPNATFFGMQKELEVLHNRLFKARARIERTTAVLISGITGSGKTHLARQYVFTQRKCYPGGVFWIDAKSRESSYKCFWEIAQAATLIDRKEAEDQEYQNSQLCVNAVRNWLQTRHEWLLIFDGIAFNHDDDFNEFKEFLPWNRKCSIIYTSIDATLRKKQHLYQPYCLSMPRLRVEDACKLLFKEIGIKKPTPEQVSKATELVDQYECLPLAIHAIGHRLNITGKPIEKYRVKDYMTDKKLAEPFLRIMSDLYLLNQRQALNLINLLSFLGHFIPVKLVNLGRGAMSAENAEILTSAQAGEDPDLDTTLGILIHYGLIERTSETGPQSFPSTSTQHSSDDINIDATPTPRILGLTESITEGSQGNSVVDVVKIHSVVQRFCQNELRIKDEEYNSALSRPDPGFYDSWLIVATRFLCKSYKAAKERMAHYRDCGLVRDYREYETHASRLVELFPKKPGIRAHPPVLREAREHLRQLMKSISNEINGTSLSSSQETSRNLKSVFDRTSSSLSSFPESAADEGISHVSTWNWTEIDREESLEQMMEPPRLKLDLFPPRIFRRAGYESEDGYETDGEGKEAPRILPAPSQISQTTEKPKPSPESASSPVPSNDQSWQLVDRHYKTRPPKDIPSKKRSISRQFRGAKPATPLVQVSPIQGRGSTSRTSTHEGTSYSILASEPLPRSTYSEPGHEYSSQLLSALDLRTAHNNTQSADDRFSIPYSGEVSASSLMTDRTTPEHQEEEALDAGITQPNDLDVVLNAVDHYKRLDDLECEVARLCGIDRSLDVQNRHTSLVECCDSTSNYLTALCHLRNEGFCRDNLIILVKDRSRPDIAKTIHVPLSTLSDLEQSLKGKDCSNISPSWNFFPLVSELHGDSVPSPAMTGDYVPFVNFLCSVFAIGLVSFSGSHVCRFDIGIMGQPMDEIPVGLGDSFRTRNLACLSSFIGGPAWVLGKSEPVAQQEELKISLTVQDFDELWGPVWLLGGSADEGRIIRTERGYIVPLPRQKQGADTEEIECHWRVEYPEYLMSEIDSDDRPMLRPTSRIIVGTDTVTEAGLTVNETCQLNISLKQQCMASRLQLSGTTRSQLVDDGFEVNLTGGQYVSAGIVKKWKRMPARTQKSVLIELCQKPNTKLSPLLKARVGLEVSACTGNAQRVTLWDALRLSQAKPTTTGNMDSPRSDCEHIIGDINCIHSCWGRSSSVEEIDNITEWRKSLTLSDARCLVIQSILALEHTGIDGEGNMQAWWPFSESPLTSRISRSTSKESHEWFRVIKDSRDASSFAVLSQRCLEFGERRCVQRLSCTSRNGSCKVYQTGLYTRILPVKGALASLVPGAKLLVGNANLTVEQASQAKGESVIIATISANPFRVLAGFLGEGKILCVQEHVHHDIPTGLSIPMFAY